MSRVKSLCRTNRSERIASWTAKPWCARLRLPKGFPSKGFSNFSTPTNAQTWDYDAVGNWDSVTTNSTTQTRGANRQNEITSVSSATTPTYDSNGNLTKDENDNRFVWDAWNMMVQVKNSSNVVIVTYGRDALHRHVADTVGSSVTDRFFSQDWQLLETKAGSSTVTRNVWSPAYVDALVLRDRDTDSNGTLDERLYSLQDANWNTTGLVNTSGAVVERYTYSPFGGVTFRDASGAALSGSSKDWVFLHQGGEKIAAGDYEFRNRVYSPTLGRWLSNDPLGFEAGDENTFRYVGNGPGNGLDPSGLEQGFWYDFILIPPIYRWVSEAGRSRDRDQKLGDIKEKQLNKEDLFDKVMKAPVGNGTAGEGRNNTFEPNFNVNNQQAKGDVRVGGQIIKAQWDYLPSVGPIFTRQMLSQSRIIATGHEIKKIDLLVGRYGGAPSQWKKKAGIDENGIEWHWYEYKGKRYGEKRDGELDPF